MIYFGRAESFDRKRIFTDYYSNICTMNAYLSPNQDMYACCDAGNRFSETGFLYLGNLRQKSIDELFKKKEQHRRIPSDPHHGADAHGFLFGVQGQ